MKRVILWVRKNIKNRRRKAGKTCKKKDIFFLSRRIFKIARGGCTTKRLACGELFFYIHSFFCLPNKRKNQRKIHLRCFSISSEIAKKLGASKTSFAVQSKVSALFPIFYQILREKQRGHFFSHWEYLKSPVVAAPPGLPRKSPAGATSPIDIKIVRRLAIQNTTESSCP